jgi:hypothetical protein
MCLHWAQRPNHRTAKGIIIIVAWQKHGWKVPPAAMMASVSSWHLALLSKSPDFAKSLLPHLENTQIGTWYCVLLHDLYSGGAAQCDLNFKSIHFWDIYMETMILFCHGRPSVKSMFLFQRYPLLQKSKAAHLGELARNICSHWKTWAKETFSLTTDSPCIMDLVSNYYIIGDWSGATSRNTE